MRSCFLPRFGIILLLLLGSPPCHAGKISLSVDVDTDHWVDAMGHTSFAPDMVSQSLQCRASR